MDLFKDELQKRLEQKRLTKQSIWAYVLQLLKRHIRYPDSASWKLQWSVFTIRLSYKEDKTGLFHKRLELIRIVNTELENAWYEERINAIKFK